MEAEDLPEPSVNVAGTACATCITPLLSKHLTCLRLADDGLSGHVTSAGALLGCPCQIFACFRLQASVFLLTRGDSSHCCLESSLSGRRVCRMAWADTNGLMARCCWASTYSQNGSRRPSRAKRKRCWHSLRNLHNTAPEQALDMLAAG